MIIIVSISTVPCTKHFIGVLYTLFQSILRTYLWYRYHYYHSFFTYEEKGIQVSELTSLRLHSSEARISTQLVWPLEKEMATHSSILAWKIPCSEEPGGLQSVELQRVRHDWATKASPPTKPEHRFYTLTNALYNFWVHNTQTKS